MKYVLNESGLINKKDPLMENVLEHMKKNLEEDLRDTILAEKFNLSLNYFIQRFKKYFGITPAAKLRSLKIEQAKYLLYFSDKNIKEIANDCGYSDVFSFSKAFKKITNLPPGQFKNLNF